LAPPAAASFLKTLAIESYALKLSGRTQAGYGLIDKAVPVGN
jgi:hypothetical protein